MNILEPLIDLCRRMVADRDLTELEARELAQWLENHYDLRHRWPGSVLNDRLNEILADGVITEGELNNLGVVLDHISDLDPRGEGLVPETVGLPLDHPIPRIEFNGKRYSFLGEFVLGPAEACFGAVRKLGGIAETGLTPETDYLVLGAVAPAALLEGDEQTVLGQALEMKGVAGRPFIVTEQHWADAFEVAVIGQPVLATVNPAPPTLPVLRRKLRVSHPVTGALHEVDLATHSCSCSDWQTRREPLAENDLGRCCPHIARALADVNAATSGPAWLSALLPYLRRNDRGLNPSDQFVEIQVAGHPMLAVVGRDWIHTFAPTPAGPYERYTFHRSEKRWAYRLMPRYGTALSVLFTDHPRFA